MTGLDSVRVGLGAAALVALLAGGLVACGGDGTTDGSTDAAVPITVPASEGTTSSTTSSPVATGEPELCQDLDVVRDSVETMRSASVGDGAVPVVAEELRTLETTLPDLRAAAAEQYESQVQELEAGMATVRTSVEAAQADTSAATVLAVTTSVRALGVSVDQLVQDVGDTC